MLLHPNTVFTEPELKLQTELGIGQGFLHLGRVKDNVDSVVY